MELASNFFPPLLHGLYITLLWPVISVVVGFCAGHTHRPGSGALSRWPLNIVGAGILHLHSRHTPADADMAVLLWRS